MSLPPGVIEADEEMRRLRMGETAGQGAVQVVMTAEEFWSYSQRVKGSQKELYVIDGGCPDLPTYGTRYARRT